MPDSNLRCARCPGQMESGVILDSARHAASARQQWVEGIPEYSWLLGLKGLKGRRRAKAVVMTYRCTSCGYLESYADLEGPT